MNKISRVPYKQIPQMASGQDSHWLIEIPTVLFLNTLFLICLETKLTHISAGRVTHR